MQLAGTMAPGGKCPLVVRFCPKALGQHQASLSVQVLSEHASKVIAEVPFKAVGLCRQLGQPQGPLPGGPNALPETFAKPRQFVDQDKVCSCAQHVVFLQVAGLGRSWATCTLLRTMYMRFAPKLQHFAKQVIQLH